MLKKILKITGLVVGGIVLLAVGFYVKVYVATQSRMNKVYHVELQPLEPAGDSAMIALGARLAVTKGCTECHGDDLGGKVFVDDGALGHLYARNLTKGKGGLPADHDMDDWVLALKHGIRRDGKPLLFMPSHEYTMLSEHDMRSIIAYVTQVPHVDRELPQSTVGPLGRILTDFGKLPLLPAELIDHTATLKKEVMPEISIAYGKYLSIACQGCHRENMKGGEPVAPGYPVVADISSTGNPGRWSDEQFMNTLRTGVTPEGKTLNPAEMPWLMTKAYTDVELKALHVYLKSL